jgi:hypothetical protein
MHDSRLVFPAPFAPVIAVISPAASVISGMLTTGSFAPL